MLPIPKEYHNLFDNILINTSLGSPRKVNVYETHGYFADTPLHPLDISLSHLTYYGKTLKVNITLSKKISHTKWEVKDPTILDVMKALKSIEHGAYPSFAILTKSKQSYIQTNVYCLEYQDGSMDDHYYCPPEYLSSMTILRAFVSYGQECSWWKESILWEKGYTP